MKIVKTIKGSLSLLVIAATFTFMSCGQPNKESEAGNSYTDTVETNHMDDNNMRNDQPTDELTQKDSSIQDSM